MTTILKIAKRYGFMTPPTAVAVALPWLPQTFSFSVSERTRRRIAIAAAVVALGAAVAYVVSVNVILFAGEAMKRDRRALSALEQQAGALAGVLAARESPVWLEERARTAGMVEAVGVRFMTQADVVAFSR